MDAQNEPTAVFAKLAIAFSIEDKVRDWLISEEGLNAKTLDDFLHAAATQADVALIADVAEPANKLLATSRLRQA
eukprot:4868586-Heterocapsa_arctica.AAC.1